MDPLSITASIIAIVTAARAVGKGISCLKSLRGIPGDFLVFANEINDLQILAEQLRSLLKQLSADGKQDITALPIPEAHLTALRSISGDMKELGDDLNALYERLQVLVSKKSDENIGEKRLSKMQWLRERGAIAKIRDRARRINQNMAPSLASLISSQSACQTTLMIGMMEVLQLKSQRQINMHAQLLQEGRAHAERHRQLEQNLCGTAAELGQLIQTSHNSLPRRPEETPAVESDINSSDANGPIISFRVTTRPACLPYCACQCHQYSHVKTPRWLRNVFGHFFMRYNRFPLLLPQRCDIRACKSTTSSLQLSYCFPQWFVYRAVYVAASWSSVAGMGGRLCFQVPRFSGSAPLCAIVHNDVSWMKQAVAAGQLYPCDVNEYGMTLISLALFYGKFDVAVFLLQQGFNVTLRDKDGRSAVGFCRQISYHQYSSSLHEVVKRVAAMGDDDEADVSTPIHDAILGNGKLSLGDALTHNGADVDKLNHVGYSPLHAAIAQEDVAAVKTLLDHGADSARVDIYGVTPLATAARLNGSHLSIDICRLLLDANADPNQPSLDNGFTPILHALDKPELVRLLLDRKAKTTVRNVYGMHNAVAIKATTLYTLQHNHPVGRQWKESLLILVNAGMDLNLPVGLMRDPPTLSASRRRNNALLSVLYKLGAPHDAVDAHGHNILHVAALHADLDQIQCLRHVQLRGVAHDAIGHYGVTPLDMISWRMNCPQEQLSIHPLFRRPTNSEFAAFKQLLSEVDELDSGDAGTLTSLSSNDQDSSDEEDEDEDVWRMPARRTRKDGPQSGSFLTSTKHSAGNNNSNNNRAWDDLGSESTGSRGLKDSDAPIGTAEGKDSTDGGVESDSSDEFFDVE